MAKNSITDYSKTASLNTDIQSVDIDEGCLPSGINNAIRELMADLAAMNDGTVTLTSPSFAAASLTGNLSFGDNNKAIFGAGSDLQIYHTGSDSVIQDAGQGDLYIKASNNLWFQGNTSNDIMARFQDNGAVTLYYDNSTKLATTSTGIDVTGTVTADGLTVDGTTSFTQKVVFDNNDELRWKDSGGTERTALYLDSSNNLNLGTSAGGNLRFINGSSYTERMRIDSSGRVGIGSSAPDKTLVVSSSSGTEIVINDSDATPNPILRFRESGSTSSTISTSSNNLIFSVPTSERMRIDSSGNAIFTKSGGAYLQLKDASAVRGSINVETSDGLVFTTGSSFTERMRIDSSGNVGIGTSSPAANLHVSGSGARKIDITDTGGANTRISTANNNSYVGSTTNHPLLFITNDAERMRIDSSGNVGIGTSSPSTDLHVYGSSPELRVQSTATNNGFIRFINTSGSMSVGMSGSAANQFLLYDRTNSHTAYLYAGGASGSHTWRTNNTERLRIDSSGRVGIGTTSPASNLHVSGDTTFDSFGSTGQLILRNANGTQSSPTALNTQNHHAYEILAQGYDGDDYDTGAMIRFETAYVPSQSDTDMPFRIDFLTSPNATATPTEAMRIHAYQSVNIANNLQTGYLTVFNTGGSYVSAGGGHSYAYTTMRGSSTTYGSLYDEVFTVHAGYGDKRIKFLLNGNGYFDGVADAGSADYAEMFEWDDGNSSNEDRVGYSVVLTNTNKIRKATSSDAATNIIGVVSGRPAIVGDTASFNWQGKWDTDDFARRKTGDVTFYRWDIEEDGETKTLIHRADDLPSDVTIPNDAEEIVSEAELISSDYDSTVEYTPRRERQQWDAVGMLGKLRLRVGQPTGDRWIKLRDIATDDNGNVTVEEWLVR